ncbi:glycosyltransferase [Pseudoxanthomonas composti]|uniref:Glycosyltransferase n=1 Tax=Pseudoxanthomonas composti TaxID=2137479 RepID=A0A4Q1JRL4_9GAMM|nr:glycosyltransferase [Pseudoxanthomonas composti]RXR00874.1 glycosyltransferase [Pseudoxanthomonas composti]
MTHFALVGPAFPSHFRALQAIAQRLVARGHRATFFHQADAAALVEPGPVAFHAVGDPARQAGTVRAMLARAANPGGPLGLKRVIGDVSLTTQMLCEALPEAFVHAGVEAVICDQMEAAGALVAQALGLPFVSVACALPINREPGIPLPVMPWEYATGPSALQLYRSSQQVYDMLMRPLDRTIAAQAARLGLGARAGLHDCLSPLAQISQTVERFDFPRQQPPPHFHHVGPLRPAAEDPPLALPLADGRKVVFASLGTLQGHRLALFKRIARACRGLKVQLVIAHCGGLSPERARALEVPGEVMVVHSVPQRAMLARADAVVTHAGLNTALDACVAGVPMLALPIAFDQPGVAARVVHAGAGLRLSARWCTARQIAQALAALLDRPAYAAAAREIGVQIGQAGGSERAADIIQATTARSPSAVPA